MRSGLEHFDPLAFIELVKARPPIYHLRNPDHHNRFVIDKLWNEIACLMGKPVIECKTKWHQLRNNYARELRFEQGLQQCKKRSEWHLKEPLAFLRAHICTSRKKSKHLKVKKEAKDDEERKDDRPKIVLAESIAFSNTNKFEAMFLDAREDEEEEEIEIDEKFIPQEEEQTQSSHDHQPVQQAQQQQHQHETKHEMARVEETSNPDLIFFESLFPDIQKLSARRKRKFKETLLITLNKLLDEDEEEVSRYRIGYDSGQQDN